MATVKIVLEVDAAAGKSAIKSFGGEVDAAFERVKRSAGTVTPAVAAADARVQQMFRNIPGYARPAEDAFEALGIRSSTSIEQARARITAAYHTIRDSGTASATDVMRAGEAWGKQMKELSGEAMPATIKAMEQEKDAGAQLNDVLTAAGVNHALLGNILTKLKNPMVAAAIATVALVGGLVSVTSAAVDNAREVQALMAVSGMEAEAADNLGNTFQLLGKDTSVLTSALFKMAQELDSGGVGLRKIGLTYEDVSRVANEGELFLLVRDKISQMGSASERSAALMAIFGRSGRELAGIFSLSREKFAAFIAEAGQLSPWSQESQQRAEELITAQTRLALSWQGLKIRLSEFLTGPARGYVDWLNTNLDLIQGRTKVGAEQHLKLLDEAFKAGLVSQRAYAFQRARIETEASANAMSLFLKQKGAEVAGAGAAASTVAKFAEQRAQAERILGDSALQGVLTRLGIEEDARKTAVTLGTTTEAAAIAERLAAVDVALAAKQRALRIELAEARNKEDQVGTAALAVQQKIVQAEREAGAQRAALRNQLTLDDRKREDGLFAEVIKRFDAEQAAAIEAAAERQKIETALTTETIKLHGTAEAAFEHQLLLETTALERAARARITEDNVLEDTLADIWRLHGKKLEGFRKAQADAEIKIETDVLRQVLAAERTQTEKVEAEYRDRFHVWDQLRANGRISETQFQRIIQDLTRETSDKLRASWQQDFNTRVAALVTTTERVRQFYAEEATIRRTAQERDLADAKTIFDGKVANLAATTARTRAFYEDTTNVRLAAQARELTEGQALLTTRLGWLTTVNDGEQKGAALRLQIQQQEQQAGGQHFGFLMTTFQLLAVQGKTTWQAISEVAVSAFGTVQRFGSDVLFGWITGTLKMRDVWEQAWRSMLRTLTDVASSVAFRQVLLLLFGPGAAGSATPGITIGSAGGGGGGGGLLALGGGGIGGGAGGGAAGLAPGVTDLFGSTGLARAFPGVANVGTNFALGGTEAALFGTQTVSAGGLTFAGADAGFAAAELGAIGVETTAASTTGLAGAGGAVSTLGAVAAGVGIALNLASAFSDLGSPQSTGTLAGTAAGAAAGALIGTFVFPGVGTVTGALLGGALGGTVGGLLGGLFGGPSERWLSFGTRLAETLELEQSSAKTLAEDLQRIADAATLANREATLRATADAIQRFEDTVATRVGGFGAANPFEVAGLPGATGTDHEGGIVADFGPQVAALQNAVDAILRVYGSTRAPSFDEGGLARVHDREIVMPRPFADEFPAFARAMPAVLDAVRESGPRRRRGDGGDLIIHGDVVVRVEGGQDLRDPRVLRAIGIEIVRATAKANRTLRRSS